MEDPIRSAVGVSPIRTVARSDCDIVPRRMPAYTNMKRAHDVMDLVVFFTLARHNANHPQLGEEPG